MPEERVVVSNSTVIIAFSYLELLSILKQLYQEITIAQEVYHELEKAKGKPGSNIDKEYWIKVKAIHDPRLKEYLSLNLDKGEAETIALAEEIKANLVLIDDFWGRKMAKRRGLKISGTLGILVTAKKNGFIKEVHPLLDKLIDFGFWMSEELYQNVLIEAEEVS